MLKKIDLSNKEEILKLGSVLVDQVFMSITTLLTTVVLARIYTKTNYADLVLLFSITLFILGFQSAIISKPYAINLNDIEDDCSLNYFHFNINLKLIFTLGIIFVFPILYYLSFDTWDMPRFLIFLFYIVAHSSYYFVRETLLSERKVKQNLIYGFICSVSLITLLVLIFLNQLRDVRIFLITASIIYMAVSIIYLLKNFQKIDTLKNLYQTYWKVNWKVGKWLLGSNLLFHLSSGIYPWMLLYLTTKDDIAVFGVLMSIGSLVNPILTALSSYLLPVFVKMNKNYNSINSNVIVWFMLFLGMAIILLLIGLFFGQQIISLLFGMKYKDLGMLVLYPFIIQAITIVFQPFKIALNAIKRTDINFWILIPRSIISITLGYYLISKFGLYGVFYTMIIENLYYQISYIIMYKKTINPYLSYE